MVDAFYEGSSSGFSSSCSREKIEYTHHAYTSTYGWMVRESLCLCLEKSRKIMFDALLYQV